MTPSYWKGPWSEGLRRSEYYSNDATVTVAENNRPVDGAEAGGPGSGRKLERATPEVGRASRTDASHGVTVDGATSD